MKDKESRWEEFKALYQKPNEKALINDLAIRSFRDTGDQDYIAARMAMRARLPVQFLWSGLQAVEKYLKCMLLLGGISSKDLSHNVAKALDRVNGELKFNISLSGSELQVFNHLVCSEGDRYLTISLHVFEYELADLDALVWKLRQYCVPLDVEHYNDPPSEQLRLRNVAAINDRLAVDADPQQGYLPTGLLEKIMQDDSNPAREALVWHNAKFGGNLPIQPEDGIGGFLVINSPLYVNPQIVGAVSKLIRLPKEKEIIKAFNALAAHREAEKKNR